LSTHHAARGAAFCAMQDVTRCEMTRQLPPGKYLNLIYTWGWRRHPPRVQVIENSLKQVPEGKPLVDWETETFGKTPRANRTTQLEAIAKIGELAPAKRMWRALMAAKQANPTEITALMANAQRAFRDWGDR